jgi:hypothetical protein
MPFSTAINVLNIICGGLKMAGCIITLPKVRREELEGPESIRLVYSSVQGLTINFSSILPRRSKPAASSKWWFAEVSAMVETMAI